MGKLSLETLRDTKNLFVSYDKAKADLAKEKESVNNELARETTQYLALLSRKSLTTTESNLILATYVLNIDKNYKKFTNIT